MFNPFIKKVVLWLFVIMVCAFGIAYGLFVNSGYKISNLNFSAIAKDSSDYNIDREEIASIEKDSPDYNVDREEIISIESIREISLHSSSISINIIPVDAKEARAHFYGKVNTTNENAIPELVVKQNGSRLSISLEKKDLMSIGYYSENLKFDVYIPKSYSQDLIAGTSSGSIFLSDLNLNRLQGNASSGSLAFKSVTAKSADLQTSSGSIMLTGFTGDLTGESSSGSITAEYTEFNNDVSLQASSGSVTLRLPESAEFYVKAKASSGSIQTTFPVTTTGTVEKNSLEGTVKSDRNRVTITTSSGSIFIRK